VLGSITTKPLIGITAGEIVNKIEPWAPITHGQSITFVQAVVAAGGIPVILPLIDDDEICRQLYDRCDAILFAGGNDPEPQLFGEAPDPTVKDVSKLRDAVEMRWMRWSLADHRSILGICRGMELLNIACGGDLYQDISTALPHASDHHLSTSAKDIEHIAHRLNLAPDSLLAKLVQVERLGANTHHHQALRRVGDGLRAVAWSEDQVIEAVEAVDGSAGFVLGVQSHPESMYIKAEPAWRPVFEAFVKAAAQ
jgi:putative glutamine amidotransferase